ncbi:hypothetical protein [Anatilimnocola floriformis]|uniref:hypothetical protein n=1 Tax=Anatilimnocola floriformis TaxID=2948575 RepID=UPI0020C5511F|nr:hypothetical protein [Anatilimnocola floriformis]
MADTFDPYREALVVETHTVWPAELGAIPAAEKVQLEAKLHAKPDACAGLEYVRVHTGFCRQITVSAADLARVRA